MGIFKIRGQHLETGKRMPHTTNALIIGGKTFQYITGDDYDVHTRSTEFGVATEAAKCERGNACEAEQQTKTTPRDQFARTRFCPGC